MPVTDSNKITIELSKKTKSACNVALAARILEMRVYINACKRTRLDDSYWQNELSEALLALAEMNGMVPA